MAAGPPSFLSASDIGQVSPELLRVVERAARDNPCLCALNPKTPATLRSEAQQKEMVKKGWSKTMRSRHRTGQAVDIVPINPETGQPDVDYMQGYTGIAAAMRKAAADENVADLTWGGDWKSFKDRPHWEVTQSAPSPASQQPAATSAYTPEQRQAAIAAIESGGNYRARGPITNRQGNRGLGKYQVMASNIPEWTRQTFGYELTPEQFLASPAAQDAVFNRIFGGYVQQYGEPGAASILFTGRPNAPDEKDVLGTTGKNYVSRYMAALDKDTSGRRIISGPESAADYAGHPQVSRAITGPESAADYAARPAIAKMGPTA